MFDNSATIGKSVVFAIESTLFSATNRFLCAFIFSIKSRTVCVMPFCASITNNTASASSSADIAAPTIALSNLRDGLKTPGVSIKTSCALPTILIARNRVRVVCTLCETIDTLRPIIWFIKVDLPAFVGPIIAINPE